MSIAFFNTDLEHEFAEYAICKVSFVVLFKLQIWQGSIVRFI